MNNIVKFDREKPNYEWNGTLDIHIAKENEVRIAVLKYLSDRHDKVFGECHCHESLDWQEKFGNDDVTICQMSPGCIDGVEVTRERDLVDSALRQFAIDRGWYGDDNDHPAFE